MSYLQESEKGHASKQEIAEALDKATLIIRGSIERLTKFKKICRYKLVFCQSVRQPTYWQITPIKTFDFTSNTETLIKHLIDLIYYANDHPNHQIKIVGNNIHELNTIQNELLNRDIESIIE